MDANGIVQDLEAYRSKTLAHLIGPWSTLWSDELALKRLITQHMPATIYYAQHERTTVYWYTLETQTPQWQLVPRSLPSWIEDQLQDVDNLAGGSGSTLADLTTVFTVHYSGEPFLLLSEVIHEFLTLVASFAVRQWQATENARWAQIGWREWAVTRYPNETPPCPEIGGVGRIRATGEMGPVTVGDLYEDLRAIRVLKVVPEPVWSLLNRAAELYAFGYLEWDFFTMAQHQATMALEASLKALYMSHHKVPLRIQVYDGQNEVVEEREFRGGLRTHRALAHEVTILRDVHRSCGSAKRRILIDGARFPAKKTDLAQWALNEEWISANEYAVLRNQFRRRDRMSHPEQAERDWISQVYGTLESCTRLVNRMWARHEAPTGLLWEHAYENPPRWGHRRV